MIDPDPADLQDRKARSSLIGLASQGKVRRFPLRREGGGWVTPLRCSLRDPSARVVLRSGDCCVVPLVFMCRVLMRVSFCLGGRLVRSWHPRLWGPEQMQRPFVRCPATMPTCFHVQQCQGFEEMIYGVADSPWAEESRRCVAVWFRCGITVRMSVHFNEHTYGTSY